MINIEDFDLKLLKIEKSHTKDIDIYYIRYITMNYSDYVQINSVNPVYLINGETNGYIDTLNLVSTNKSKKVLIKYTEL